MIPAWLGASQLRVRCAAAVDTPFLVQPGHPARIDERRSVAASCVGVPRAATQLLFHAHVKHLW